MRYYVFASGSKGNCTLISSSNRYLLIDNGLSHRAFKGHLSNINVDFEKINTVLVTHKHSDHCIGLDIFQLENIYSSKQTTVLLDENHELKPYKTYYLNGFKVTVIPTSHDASGSIGFVIEDDDEKLVYVTDTGYLYDKVMDYLKDADYYIFESNHDVRMLLATDRPQYLIDRIMGDKGHLSNEDSALYLSELISSRTKEVVLAHLSEEANTPELALSAFTKIMSKRCINISSLSVRCASQRTMLTGGNLEKEVING